MSHRDHRDDGDPVEGIVYGLLITAAVVLLIAAAAVAL